MSDAPIRLFLIDHHLAFRAALAYVLEREPDLRVVGHAGSLAEGRAALAALREALDVAFVEFELPDGEGITFVGDLRARFANCQSIVLTGSTDRRDHARVIALGAAGVLHKSASLHEIITAVRRLFAGETLHAPHELMALLREETHARARELAATAAFGRLTPREREILQALTAGMSDKELALRFKVSAKTISSHVANILAKLGVDSRLQAVLLALRHGVTTLD